MDSWVLELARKQKMNTDVRKNVFAVIITSEVGIYVCNLMYAYTFDALCIYVLYSKNKFIADFLNLRLLI